ncbi:OLC1v1035948C1 [Oldenlandia corymbosa var. corymbosa]|uniref:OLC1v1035948C1 n=1 Tax=Oldenlandia corymbosa var. corymbosa TaxID=529605 RepID=A0AAV1CXD0_OLDCO|nr:OLC1v1035948C1 [Oldenlandia corymbosa var. corymbosa]
MYTVGSPKSYQLSSQAKASSFLQPNEIRVTGKGNIRNYVSCALHVLRGAGLSRVSIQALGSRPTAKDVLAVQLIKQKVPCLDQHTSTGSVLVEGASDHVLPTCHRQQVHRRWKSKIVLTLSSRQQLSWSPPSSRIGRAVNPRPCPKSHEQQSSYTISTQGPMKSQEKRGNQVWKRKELLSVGGVEIMYVSLESTDDAGFHHDDTDAF